MWFVCKEKGWTLDILSTILLAGVGVFFFFPEIQICMDYHSLVDLQFDLLNALKPFQKAPFVKIRWTLFWLVYENMWLSQKVCVPKLNKHIQKGTVLVLMAFKMFGVGFLCRSTYILINMSSGACLGCQVSWKSLLHPDRIVWIITAWFEEHKNCKLNSTSCRRTVQTLAVTREI